MFFPNIAQYLSKYCEPVSRALLEIFTNWIGEGQSILIHLLK